MSQAAAYRLMQVADNLGASLSPAIKTIPAKALYLLVAPAADDVREEVTAKVEAGEVAPTHAAIRKAVDVPPGTRR